MDLRKIKKLIELLEDSALVEMEITEGENTIRLSRASMTPAPVAAPPVAIPTVAVEASPANENDANSSIDLNGEVVTSPMVGTFYAANSPDDPPFVSEGSRVKVGDTLCLIEAMKTYNRVESEVEGTIKSVLRNSGDPVEYGEPLFVIE